MENENLACLLRGLGASYRAISDNSAVSHQKDFKTILRGLERLTRQTQEGEFDWSFHHDKNDTAFEVLGGILQLALNAHILATGGMGDAGISVLYGTAMTKEHLKQDRDDFLDAAAAVSMALSCGDMWRILLKHG